MQQILRLSPGLSFRAILLATADVAGWRWAEPPKANGHILPEERHVAVILNGCQTIGE